MDTLGKQVRELLENHGIKRDSKSWVDYERGKELLLLLPHPPDSEWHRACQIIADYLGV